MLELLTKKFHNTKNEDLVIDLGVSLRTMIRKARQLELKKDSEWMHEQSERGLQAMHDYNKFVKNSGMFKAGEHHCPKHEFKKK